MPYDKYHESLRKLAHAFEQFAKLYQRSPHPRADHKVHYPPLWTVCADFTHEEEED